LVQIRSFLIGSNQESSLLWCQIRRHFLALFFFGDPMSSDCLCPCVCLCPILANSLRKRLSLFLFRYVLSSYFCIGQCCDPTDRGALCQSGRFVHPLQASRAARGGGRGAGFVQHRQFDAEAGMPYRPQPQSYPYP
jgi:hypothetical protein